MKYATLSLEQAPPLSVPLRFFLTAPLFAAAAALLLLYYGPDALANRWQPAALAIAHLLTLGFLALAMVGAVQQLLPVLVGSPVPRPRLVSAFLYGFLTLGTLALVSGFLSGRVGLMHGAVGLLGLGFLLFVSVTGWCLARSRSGHFTVVAMALAVAALTVTVALGAYLALGYAGTVPLARWLTDLHLGWGLLGWVTLLIIGVAYQVVPMFQITPDYPRPLMRFAAPFLFAALALWSLARGVDALPETLAIPAAVLAALGYTLFAAATLDVQRRRKRRLADVTLDFWRMAMVCLLAVVLAWVGGHLTGRMPELLLAVLFIIGVALSAINGMLYKIVPFLVWLHLNNRLQAAARPQGGIPTMRKVIPEASMRWQFRLQLAALLLLSGAALWSPLVRPAGLLFLASMLLLGWNLLSALRLYRRTLRR